MSEEPVHSRLPPSGAFRWTVCTASVAFVEKNDAILPKDDSVYAAEGTRAHTYLTALLRNEPGKPDNDEMDGIVKKLVQAIRDLIQPGERLMVDQRLPLFYLPSQKGTLDVALVGRKRIVVLDLKYGAGVSVHAEHNKQLASYAESLVQTLEMIEPVADDVEMLLVIYQPRDRNDDNPWREWKITRGQLREFCRSIEAAAEIILGGHPTEFRPGEACKFCRATGICTAYATQGLEALSDEPVDVVVSQSRLTQLVSPESLTREQRQKILAAKATLIAWLEAVENQEVAELLNGTAPDKFKLVEGKTNRVWVDEQKVASLLLTALKHDQIYPPVKPTLVSPAQAEKLLKGVEIPDTLKTGLSNLITKPEGKPTLVPVTDKRPALEFNPTAGLEKLDVDARDLI